MTWIRISSEDWSAVYYIIKILIIGIVIGYLIRYFQKRKKEIRN
jgi:hypothetical protein